MSEEKNKSLKLRLNVWQRVTLVDFIGGIRGYARDVRKAFKLLDILELTDAEKKAVGFRTPAPRVSVWDDHDVVYEIEIKDKNLASFLKKKAAAFEGWPVSEHVLGLFEQLDIKEDDGE